MQLTIHSDLDRKLVVEAAKRAMSPADLAERLLETVLRDDLVRAVLDE